MAPVCDRTVPDGEIGLPIRWFLGAPQRAATGWSWISRALDGTSAEYRIARVSDELTDLRLGNRLQDLPFEGRSDAFLLPERTYSRPCDRWLVLTSTFEGPVVAVAYDGEGARVGPVTELEALRVGSPVSVVPRTYGFEVAATANEGCSATLRTYQLSQEGTLRSSSEFDFGPGMTIETLVPVASGWVVVHRPCPATSSRRLARVDDDGPTGSRELSLSNGRSARILPTATRLVALSVEPSGSSSVLVAEVFDLEGNLLGSVPVLTIDRGTLGLPFAAVAEETHRDAFGLLLPQTVESGVERRWFLRFDRDGAVQAEGIYDGDPAVPVNWVGWFGDRYGLHLHVDGAEVLRRRACARE